MRRGFGVVAIVIAGVLHRQHTVVIRNAYILTECAQTVKVGSGRGHDHGWISGGKILLAESKLDILLRHVRLVVQAGAVTIRFDFSLE